MFDNWSVYSNIKANNTKLVLLICYVVHLLDRTNTCRSLKSSMINILFIKLYIKILYSEQIENHCGLQAFFFNTFSQ